LKSTHRDILAILDQCDRGKILFPVDFRGLGSVTAIKMSLSRMAANGNLIRLAQGIYMKPQRSRKNVDLAFLESIAQAIAKKHCVRIKATGNLAAYKLGLTAKMPSDLTYVTDGEPRDVQIEGHRIIFRSTTPKKLQMKGTVSSLLIQLMEELGKGAIDADMMNKMIGLLNKEDQNKLMHDMALASAWVYGVWYKSTKASLKIEDDKINN